MQEEGKAIRLFSNLPLNVVYGGFECQCVQTCLALQKIGMNAKLWDWHDRKDVAEILHIFGLIPYLERVVKFNSINKKYFVSILMGMSNSNFKNHINRLLATLLKNRYMFSQNQLLLQHAAGVFCLNEYEKAMAISCFRLDPKKVIIVPNGVNESRFNAKASLFMDTFNIKAPYVLYVGSIIQRKNPIDLAMALAKTDIKGVFIGKPMATEQVYFERFRKVISENTNLMWIEELPYDSELLCSSYAGCSLFCLPSSSETQPLSAMEAMAASRPIILGDREYAYAEPFGHSIKVCIGDIDDLRNKIRQILSNEDIYCHTLDKSYTWNCIARTLASCYFKDE